MCSTRGLLVMESAAMRFGERGSCEVGDDGPLMEAKCTGDAERGVDAGTGVLVGSAMGEVARDCRETRNKFRSLTVSRREESEARLVNEDDQ